MPVALVGARLAGKFCGTLEGMGISDFADEEKFFLLQTGVFTKKRSIF